MYENDVNASQFNTFDTNAATANISRIEQLQNLSGNMKLRGGLLIADAAQRLARPTLRGANSGAVSFRSQLESTRKLQEQSVKSLGEIEKASKKAFSPFEKNIPKSFDDFAKSAQKAFEPTNTLIGNTRKLVAGLEDGLEKLATATFITKSIEILVNGLSRVKDEINGVSSSLKVLNKSGFDPALLKSLNDFEDSLTSFDFSNTEEFATSFVAQYTQITEGLAQVGTLIPEQLKKASDEGRSYLGDLFDDIQDMVNGELKNAVSSSEAISATYTALQAGIGDNNMTVVNDTVKNTLKLIASQGGDANQVMELLAQTMTAFNMSANSSGEILGKLNELVNVGITTIPELSQGFGQLGVGASAAGLTLDELTVGMAALTKSGSNTYSAMTSLQNLFNKISSGSVTDRLAEMGVTLGGNAVRFDAASVSSKGFSQSIEELNRALGGSQEKIQQAFGGDQEAIRGFRGWLKNTKSDLEAITKAITNAGAKNLEEAFNIKIDNDKILQFEQVLNRVSEIALKLGKLLTPLFSKGLDRIEKNIDRIAYLTQNYGGLIVKIVELNLAMKALTGVFGVLIGTVGKLALAYGVWLLASGKLLKNGMQVWKMLTDQNRALNQNNILWSKNTSTFNKILAVFGQLLGFYDLERAGQTKLTKEQEKKIALEAKQRAIQASAHKQTMEELEKQQEMYEKVNKIRQGKGENRAQNIFNEQRVLGEDREKLVKQQEDLRADLGVIAPKKIELDEEKNYLKSEISRRDITEEERKTRIKQLEATEKEIQKTEIERNEKIKQLKTTQKQIKETDEITALNDVKIKRYEKLREVNESGESDVDIMRRSISDLEKKDPAKLTKEEKGYLKSTRKELAQFDDIELARRAKDYNQDDEYNYRQNVATKKYISENENKPSFKRDVKRAERVDNKRDIRTISAELEKLTPGTKEYKEAQKRLQNVKSQKTKVIEAFEKEDEFGLTVKDIKTFDIEDAREKMRTLNKDDEEYKKQERIISRNQKSLDIYQNVKKQKKLEGTNLAGGKLGDNSFTESTAQLIDDITGIPAVLQEASLKIGEFTKNLKKNIAESISALVSFSKSMLTFKNVSMGVIGGLVALTGALFVEGEKNAQKSRDLLEAAGLNKNDSDIVSPFDALKKQLVDFGKWIIESLDVSFNAIKKGITMVARFITNVVLAIPRAIVQGFNAAETAVVSVINTVMEKLNMIPGLNIAPVWDMSEVKNEQQKRLQNLDKLGADIVNKFTKPLDDAGNAFTRFVKDVTYAVTEANEDIARAKIYERIDQNNLEIKQLDRKLGNLNTLDKGGRFSDVTIKTGVDKKGEDVTETFNLSNVLKEVITTNTLTDTKVNLFNEVASQTQSELKSTYRKFEETVKQNEQADKALRTNLVDNMKLSSGQDKAVLDSVVQARIEVEVRRLKGDKNATLDVNNLTEKERALNASLNQTQRDEIDRYTREAAKTAMNSDSANTYNKNLNDLTKVITAVQTFVKNRSDIGGSNNPDATRAVKGFDNTTKLLGQNVKEFAKSLSTLSESQYSQEELMRLAKEEPEKYKKIVEDSGADFAGSANIFNEIQNQIPGIIEQLQNNAQLGYISPEDKKRGLSADTSKAQRFQEILDKQVTKQFEDAGFTKEQAQNYKDTLLADQKIREQIFALEQDDYQKRLQRLDKQKEIFEVVKQSELLVTKNVIEESQKIEEKSLQESIAFAQKRVQTLKQGSDNLDPQIIKDAETDVKVLEEKLIIQRINQKRELLDYESKMVKDAYEKRYAEIEELVLRGEKTFSTDERIKFESEKQQKILELNVQTQMKLREILTREGKLTAETQIRIEKDIQEARVNLLRSYIEEAKQRYDNLAQNIQKIGDAESNYLSASINKLGVKTEIYDKINQLISQQKSLFDSAQSNLERDASFIRNNLVSRRKQIEFEKLYYAQRKKALAEQLAFERQSLEVQKQQNELLVKRLKIEQDIKEKTAKLELTKAIIKEEAVMSDGSSSEADKLTAQADRKIAEMNVEAAYINRDNIAAQEALMRNEVSLKEYELNQKTRQGFQDIERDYAGYTRTKTDDARLVNQTYFDFQNGNYPRMPELSIPTIDTTKREQEAKSEIEKVKTSIKDETKGIRDDLTKKIKDVDTNLKKPVEDILKVGQTQSDTQTKITLDLKTLIEHNKTIIDKHGESIKVQSKVYDSQEKNIKAQESQHKNNVEMSGKILSTLEKILNKSDKNQEPNTQGLPVNPQPKRTGGIESVIENTMREMLEMSGMKLEDIPEYKLPKVRFAKEQRPGWGGDYNFGTNELRISEKYKDEVANLDESGMRILVHELRHWMQDEGLNKGWLTTQNITDPEKRKWAEESGVPFSGNNKWERDAYGFDGEYTDDIIREIIGNASVISNSNTKENVSSIIENELVKQTKLQETIIKYVEKLYAGENVKASVDQNDKQNKNKVKQKDETVDVVSVDDKGKQVGKTQKIKVISKERANEIKAQKDLGEKVRRDNNTYYQTLAELGGVVDVSPNAKPENQIKQLKTFVDQQVKQAYKMHTEGKLGAQQTQQFVKDWRTNEKEYAQILQRGVLNPNQEVEKLKKQQAEQRNKREKQVEKASGVKNVQQPLASVQKQIDGAKANITKPVENVAQKPQQNAENIKFDKSQILPNKPKPNTIYVGQGYISPNVRKQLGIGAEGKDGRKTDPKTGLALDPAFGWTEEYMPLKKKQGDLNRETDRLWSQYANSGEYTYEQVQKMAEKNVGWSEKDSYDNKFRIFDSQKTQWEKIQKDPKADVKSKQKALVALEQLKLQKQDAEDREKAGYYKSGGTMSWEMQPELRARLNVLESQAFKLGLPSVGSSALSPLVLQPELDIIEQERKKGGKNNPYLLSQNTPSFKYEGQQGQILAGLSANTNNANKLNNSQNTNNNTTNQNKNVNVTLSPKIEIKIEKDTDEKLAKNTAEEINKQLFSIFNEVAYNL